METKRKRDMKGIRKTMAMVLTGALCVGLAFCGSGTTDGNGSRGGTDSGQAQGEESGVCGNRNE